MTPNPDLLCNEFIKFASFKESISVNTMFATGHYAQLETRDGDVALLKAADCSKDQTYFLARLRQSQLRDVIFPLGQMHKHDVRTIAKSQNFPNQDSRESMGICFIEQGKLAPFLSKYLLDKPGLICDAEGNEIGTHNGLFYHTVGQRKGLNIGGVSGYENKPFYVLHKDFQRNRLIVTQNQYDEGLLQDVIHGANTHSIREPLPLNEQIHAKVRHQQLDQACYIDHNSAGACRVVFEQPQRAVAPGQYIVFYRGDECLGSTMVVNDECV